MPTRSAGPRTDVRVDEHVRFVQVTPPGSACSFAFGQGIVDGVPGSVQGVQVVDADVEAARAELLERGVTVGEVQHLDWGSFVGFRHTPPATPGPCTSCPTAAAEPTPAGAGHGP